MQGVCVCSIVALHESGVVGVEECHVVSAVEDKRLLGLPGLPPSPARGCGRALWIWRSHCHLHWGRQAALAGSRSWCLQKTTNGYFVYTLLLEDNMYFTKQSTQESCNTIIKNHHEHNVNVDRPNILRRTQPSKEREPVMDFLVSWSRDVLWPDNSTLWSFPDTATLWTTAACRSPIVMDNSMRAVQQASWCWSASPGHNELITFPKHPLWHNYSVLFLIIRQSTTDQFYITTDKQFIIINKWY